MASAPTVKVNVNRNKERSSYEQCKFCLQPTNSLLEVSVGKDITRYDCCPDCASKLRKHWRDKLLKDSIDMLSLSIKVNEEIKKVTGKIMVDGEIVEVHPLKRGEKQ
jgi:hypothetical protein